MSHYIILFILIISTTTIIIFVFKSIYRFFNMPYTEPNSFPTPQYVNAEVVSKWNYMDKQGGSSYCTHKIIYIAEFLTQSGETVKYEIPEKTYLKLENHSKGNLITIDGEFFDFE